tara:strand:+ start:2359 stop:3663 length:1305 start_codon:yes stop_codon:yes gene_type:complete
MNSPLPKPGHYNLTACILVNQETKNAIDLMGGPLSAFTVTESINQNSMQFKADIHESISDAYSLLDGTEVLFCEWRSPAYVKELTPRRHVFRVTNIGGLFFDPQTERYEYTIAGIDELCYDQEYNNIGTAYSDTITSIADKIFNHALDNAIVELSEPEGYKLKTDDTEGVVDLIIPNECPFKAIEYLRGYTYSSKHPSSQFLFFQNKDGYNFRNIESLVTDGKSFLKSKVNRKMLSYTYAPAQQRVNTSDNIEMSYQIENLVQFTKNNLYSDANIGAFHSCVNEIDYMFKDITVHEKKINTTDYIGFDKKQIMPAKYLDTFNKEPTSTEYIYTDGFKTNRPNLAESINQKKLSSALFYSNMVQITVAGNSELTAGQVINITVPSRVITDREPGAAYDLNENLSGVYIIKDVQHIFVSGIYTSIATLVRSNYAGK